MAIRKHISWTGKKFSGYVDIGAEQANDDSEPVATEALVLMVVSLNSHWKVPIGYFLVNGLPGKERANIVQQCLIKLHEVGVKVVSVTCDGPCFHFAMMKELGAKIHLPNIVPYFPHPCDSTSSVCVIFDACHMIKLIRNALASLGCIKDCNGDLIKWSFLTSLHKLQEHEGLHLANKLSRSHIMWFKQKMKVNLAVQTLSSSVADAIEFCNNHLHLNEFKHSEATVRFLRTFDALFDILNSRNALGKFNKAPMCPSNENHWRALLSDAYQYILTLTDVNGIPLHTTKRKTGVIGFLIDIKSVSLVYESLAPQTLKYLLTYKLSQDHLELFFAAVRASGGCNNNPTAAQFMSAYKRLLTKHQIASATDNCNIQDQTTILHVTVDKSSVIINPGFLEISLIKRYDLQERTMPKITTLPTFQIRAKSQSTKRRLFHTLLDMSLK